MKACFHLLLKKVNLFISEYESARKTETELGVNIGLQGEEIFIDQDKREIKYI